MDFAFSEEQQALRDLATQIFTDRCTHDRLKELEAAGGSVFDRELWQELARAGILGAVVPEDCGGAGASGLDLLGVYEAAGQAVAPVPLVATLALGVPAIARYATDPQRAALLRGVVNGDVVLTAAVEEPFAEADDLAGNWRLTGELAAVPYGAEATTVVVAAAVGTDVGLFLVNPRDAEVVELLSTNRQPLATIVLEGVPGELLTVDPDAARWVREGGAAAVCAVQAGVCRRAVRMLAEYTANRRQFDKPIAEFQAVAQRAADAYIDAEMVRLTAWEAMYLHSEQARGATNAVHVAKFWAGDGAMRVVHAAQHLHGGLGVDVDYPLHRYFLWAKQIEHTLGTPTRELVRLGAALADEPV